MIKQGFDFFINDYIDFEKLEGGLKYHLNMITQTYIIHLK